MANASSMMQPPTPDYDGQQQYAAQQSPYASSSFSPYPPTASTSSLAPPPHLAGDTRPQKRRHTNEPNGHFPESSPPAPRPPSSAPRTNGTRPNTANGGPLSTSDPGFSSFVDAAAALTGLSRVPSDPSVNGGEDGEQGAGEDDARRVPNGHGAGERPRTPEAKGKGVLGALGGAGTGGESSAEGAAELMLFLAASPSPVQVRTGAARPALGGDGLEGMKGRRLFSGVGMGGGRDDFSAPPTQSSSVQSVFGDHLGSTNSPHQQHHPTLATSPYNDEPSKSSLHYSTSASAPPGGASSLGNGLPPPLAAPGTPTRDRQPSGSNWESYLNVSPSPQRAQVDRSEAAMAARREERGPPPVFGMPMTSLPAGGSPMGRSMGQEGGGW